MPLSIAVILNASAGADNKKDTADHLSRLFSDGGLDVQVTLAPSGTHIVQAARRAANDNPRVIIAGGGDGTMNAVASVLVGTGIPLGVLPLGTLNHFAKDLHIPLDLAEATATIIAGHVAEIDVGEVNGHIFLNNSSLGLYPNIVYHREKRQVQLGRGKLSAFVWATLGALRRYPFLRVRLRVNGQSMMRSTPFVFIGNNQYEMDSFRIGSRGCMNAGQLKLYMHHHTGRLGLLRLALRALVGRLRPAKDFDMLWLYEAMIETGHKRLRRATDGEVALMDTPLHYRVRPGALRVIVPDSAKQVEHES